MTGEQISGNRVIVIMFSYLTSVCSIHLLHFKNCDITFLGRSSRTLPPITPQPTPAWQKTIDKFLPKPEKVNEVSKKNSNQLLGLSGF